MARNFKKILLLGLEPGLKKVKLRITVNRKDLFFPVTYGYRLSGSSTLGKNWQGIVFG